MSTATQKSKKDAESGDRSAVERTSELSERVLEQVRDSQESAIEAVRGFMESVDEALPPQSEDGVRSRRQDVIDSALEMSERLVKTQYDFLTNVVRGAGEALGASAKKS